jgi:hypothetical protein
VGNTVLTPQVLTNELLRRFKNNLGFGMAVDHASYGKRFAIEGAKIGDTLSLREPVRLVATDGPTLVIQDVEERKIPLVINERKLTAFQFDSSEMTLSVDYVGSRYIESAALAQANAVEVSGLKMAYQQTPNVVGTPGTIPSGTTAFATYLSAGEALDRNSAPMDGERFMIIGPKFQTPIVDTLKGLFQSTEQIKRQYLKGRMGTAAGFEWSLAQNLRTHTLGAVTGGSPQVDGANQIGSTLNIKNLTANSPAFKAGDVITQALSYAVNAVSGDTLSDLRQFTILTDAVTDGSGKAVLNIYPPMAVVGDPNKPNPYATMSTLFADGAALVLFGTAGTLSPQAIAFHKDAFSLACVPMVLPHAVESAKRATDPRTGISIRTIQVYDGINDLFFHRCETMFGWVAPRKDWACRIAG